MTASYDSSINAAAWRHRWRFDFSPRSEEACASRIWWRLVQVAILDEDGWGSAHPFLSCRPVGEFGRCFVLAVSNQAIADLMNRHFFVDLRDACTMTGLFKCVVYTRAAILAALSRPPASLLDAAPMGRKAAWTRSPRFNIFAARR